MKLAALFAAMQGLAEGGIDEVARGLYGETSLAMARRLAVYARSLRQQRFEAVDHVFAQTKGAICALGGEAAWSEVVDRYFRTHPARRFEINANGEELPTFLRESLAHLPAWISELGDFEWWAWQAECARDGDDRPEGAVRLASTVELRAYEHDLPRWLEADARPDAPEARKTIVLFWRDRDEDSRQVVATLPVVAVLKWVFEDRHTGDPVACASAAGVTSAEWTKTVALLRDCGVLVGAR
jgi:hypothetical protein